MSGLDEQSPQRTVRLAMHLRYSPMDMRVLRNQIEGYENGRELYHDVANRYKYVYSEPTDTGSLQILIINAFNYAIRYLHIDYRGEMDWQATISPPQEALDDGQIQNIIRFVRERQLNRTIVGYERRSRESIRREDDE
jgi:hypothetical protein